MQLSQDIAAHSRVFLALEAAASAAYNGFVYADRAEAENVRTLLFEKEVAEFSAPFSRLAIDGDDIVGMISCLPGSQVHKSRLRCALALNRSGVFRGNEPLRDRMELASETLIRPEPTDFYLSRIAVRPDAIGRGYAGWLLRWLEGVARDHDAQRLILEVAADNVSAIALYEKSGFGRFGGGSVADPETGRQLEYLHLAKLIGEN